MIGAESKLFAPQPNSREEFGIHMLNKQKKKNIMSGAAALTVCAFIAKLLGALYRIPLTNILGAEGMGMYQLVFPIYALLLTVSSGALPGAISRLISEKRALGDEVGRLEVFKAAKIILFVCGILATILLAAFALPVAMLQGHEGAVWGYYAIAPSVFFVCIIAGLRGWFQGNMNMTPTAVSQIIEQIVKLASGLALAAAFLPYGLPAAVAGALLGVTISEILAVIYLLGTYRFSAHETVSVKGKLRLRGKEVLKIALPMTAGGIIFPLTQVIDSVLIINLMTSRGFGAGYSTAMYGLLTGPVNSLINMPVVLTLSLAVIMVPVLSGKRIERDLLTIKEKSRFSVKLTMGISIPCAILLFVFSNGIITLLYPNLTQQQTQKTVLLLAVSAVNVIFLSAQQVYTSMLQALAKTGVPVKIMAFSAALKIIGDIAFLQFTDIEGVAAASVISFGVSMVLNIWYYKKLTGSMADIGKSVSKFAVSGVIMGLVGYFVYEAAAFSTVGMILGALTAIAVYGFIMLVTNAFSDGELRSLPLGKGLVKLKTILRLGR